MSKRTVIITIEVDMDNSEVNEWVNPENFFEYEVDEALREVVSISRPALRGKKYYDGYSEITETGASSFSIKIKNKQHDKEQTYYRI